MKIVSAAALVALANFASAGQVSNDLSNENIRDADSVLKEHAKIDAAAEHAAAADDISDACDAKTKVLSTCFKDNNEAHRLACWEDCVAPAAEAFDKCDDFCNSVEQCRRGKCSSGPACASTYYDVLNCILEDDENAEDCACTGSLDLEETPAVEDATEEVADVIASVEEEAVMSPPEAVDDGVCMDETKDLNKCFVDAEEADGAGCWEDCLIPAAENFDTCDGFCATIEQCRSEKCSSGPACAGQYHRALECILEGSEGDGLAECSCASMLKRIAVEDAEKDIPDVCMDSTRGLMECFNENEEADGVACWEDCVVPANEKYETCESFCGAIETCRGEKCSSGSACADSYYDVLNCLSDTSSEEECTCGGVAKADATAEGLCVPGDATEICAEA